MAYDVVSNATLWFVHHHLFDLARRPRFDAHFARRVGRLPHASTSSSPTPSPRKRPTTPRCSCRTTTSRCSRPRLRDSRPDLRLVHFSHTPFAVPDLLRVLPAEPLTELLDGMAEHDACGFHSARWAAAFIDSCREILGARTRRRSSRRSHPMPAISATAPPRPNAKPRSTRLDDAVGDRQLIVRVDRIELSKNILRGFHAFDDMLERYPQLARAGRCSPRSCYPSREGLPEYLAYRQEVETLVRLLNDKWSTADWTPILFDSSDDYPRSVAALRRYDVLLVNPIRDGLNLVAKEGAIVNERDGLVVLSTEAGAFDELDGAVRAINPFDVVRHGGRHRRGIVLVRQPSESPESTELSSTRRAARPTDVARRPAAAPPNSAVRRAWRLSARYCMRSRTPNGSSTTTSAREINSSGSSALRTATRTVCRPAPANRSSASNARRSPTSSPMNATPVKPSESSTSALPLSAGIGGCNSYDMRAGSALETRTDRLRLGERRAPAARDAAAPGSAG